MGDIADSIMGWFGRTKANTSLSTKPTQAVAERETREIVVGSDREESLKLQLSSDRPGTWTSDHYEETRQYTGWNYAAISAMASQCAQAKVRGLKFDDSRTEDDKGEPLLYNDSLLKFVREPNPHQCGSMFRYEQAVQLRLTGTCLIWNIRNGFGKIIERYVIPTAIAEPNSPTRQYPMGYWRINPVGSRYDTAFLLGGLVHTIGHNIDARDVQAIRLPHPLHKDDGQSSVSAMALWTDNSTQIDISQNASMRNAAKPSMLVAVNQLLDQDQKDAVTSKLNQQYAGAAKDGKIMVIEAEGISVSQLSQTAEEMDYNESSDKLRDKILAGHKTPPIALGMESPTGRDGLYAPLAQYAFFAVQPLLDMLAKEDNRAFAWQYGEGYEVKYEAATIKDEENERKDTDQLINGRALTKDELREIHGKQPFGGDRGDELAGTEDKPDEPDPAIMPPAPGMPPKENPDEKTDDEPSANEDDEGVSTGNGSQLKKSLRAIIREELESIVAESIRKAEDSCGASSGPGGGFGPGNTCGKNRFEVGRSLSVEERKTVMDTLVDAYVVNGIEKVVKRYNRDGDPVYGYPYVPEVFDTSDITGAKIRYSVKLPDGSVAHPSELFPDVTKAKIENQIAKEQFDAEQNERHEADLNRSRQERIGVSSMEAQRKYMKTGRMMSYSYMAKKGDSQFVRVDGKSQSDIDYYSDNGFEASGSTLGVMDYEEGKLKRSFKATVRKGSESDIPESVRKLHPEIFSVEPEQKSWLGKVTDDLLDSLVADDLNVSTRG